MTDGLKTSLQAILWGGMAAGAADIISAIGGKGGKALQVLQYVASGLIGMSALDGGWLTGAVGLAVHFGLTTLMAALFVLAAQRWIVLQQRPWGAGFVYGALLYGAMFYVIVPYLSAAPRWKTPQGFWSNLSAAMAHGFFVGVPIASVARHFLAGQAQPQSSSLLMRGAVEARR